MVSVDQEFALKGSATVSTTWNINSCTLWDNGYDDNDYDNGGIAHKISSSGSTVTCNVLNTISVGNKTAATQTNGASGHDYNQGPTGTYNWDIHNSISSDQSLTNCDTGAVGGLEDVLPFATDQGSGSFVIFENLTLATADLRLTDLDNAKNKAQDQHATASGAGMTIPTSAGDIVGTVRPQNTNYEIGAFEIVVAAAGGSKKGSLMLMGVGI